MVLLNFPQLEWMLFYFAPANYRNLFTARPEAGWVPESFSGPWEHWWTWLSLPSSSRATPTPPTPPDPILAPSRDAAGSPALFLNSYLAVLLCPWPWMVTLVLADVPQPGSRACGHHHAARLSWLGRGGAAPRQRGHCPPAPWLPLAPRPRGSPWPAQKPGSELRPSWALSWAPWRPAPTVVPQPLPSPGLQARAQSCPCPTLSPTELAKEQEKSKALYFRLRFSTKPRSQNLHLWYK